MRGRTRELLEKGAFGLTSVRATCRSFVSFDRIPTRMRSPACFREVWQAQC